MTSGPRFSIIVPAHNEEELLPRGLEALRCAIARSASSAEIAVTIDADTVIHPDALVEVNQLVDSGVVVGGRCRFVMEGNSLGLARSAVSSCVP